MPEQSVYVRERCGMLRHAWKPASHTSTVDPPSTAATVRSMGRPLTAATLLLLLRVLCVLLLAPLCYTRNAAPPSLSLPRFVESGKRPG